MDMSWCRMCQSGASTAELAHVLLQLGAQLVGGHAELLGRAVERVRELADLDPGAEAPSPILPVLRHRRRVLDADVHVALGQRRERRAGALEQALLVAAHLVLVGSLRRSATTPASSLPSSKVARDALITSFDLRGRAGGLAVEVA